jgi:hypothetical protein
MSAIVIIVKLYANSPNGQAGLPVSGTAIVSFGYVRAILVYNKAWIVVPG